MKQYAALDDVIYLWFASNDTSGSGGDGASAAADVRLAGAAAGAAPVYSPTPTLLSHTDYPAGSYEIAITASAANGFATNNTYAVFCTLAIDSQNPTGFVGSFDLKPVESNLIRIGDVAQSATDLKNFADAGYDPATNKVQGVVLCDTTTTNTDMIGTNGANTITPPTVSEIRTEMDTNSVDLNAILADTDELQTNQGNWATAIGFNTVVPDAAGVVPTAVEIRQEMDTNSTKMAPSQNLADYKATGFNTVVPDLAGTAAGLHATTDALINGLDDITVADIIAGISDGTYDLQEIQRLMFAALVGKVSGGGTPTITYRNPPDNKNRIIATVDVNGNRTVVNLDGT